MLIYFAPYKGKSEIKLSKIKSKFIPYKYSFKHKMYIKFFTRINSQNKLST